MGCPPVHMLSTWINTVACVTAPSETLSGSSMLTPSALSTTWNTLTLADESYPPLLHQSPPISAASPWTQLFPSVRWNAGPLCFCFTCSFTAACPFSPPMEFNHFQYEYSIPSTRWVPWDDSTVLHFSVFECLFNSCRYTKISHLELLINKSKHDH